jgi:hypothetical protein
MKARRKKSKVQGSRAARKTAGVVLEVLAGQLSPTEAAEVLGISSQGYYLLEGRALDGLVAGCEPRPKGRTRTAADEVVALKKEMSKLKRDCARYQTLARVAQRNAGIAVPKRKKTEAKKKRRRKPTVRALKAAKDLKQDKQEPEQDKNKNKQQEV